MRKEHLHLERNVLRMDIIKGCKIHTVEKLNQGMVLTRF